ncbi:MAG: hypothetical protein AAF380_00645 [Bacteroidota bacterium]
MQPDLEKLNTILTKAKQEMDEEAKKAMESVSGNTKEASFKQLKKIETNYIQQIEQAQKTIQEKIDRIYPAVMNFIRKIQLLSDTSNLFSAIKNYQFQVKGKVEDTYNNKRLEAARLEEELLAKKKKEESKQAYQAGLKELNRIVNTAKEKMNKILSSEATLSKAFATIRPHTAKSSKK